MSISLASPFIYGLILAALIALTLLTVGISFFDLSGPWHLALGLVIAIGKASLVALFFMHLITAKGTTWAVVAVALFWAVVVLGTLTFSDYGWRSYFPYTPGH